MMPHSGVVDAAAKGVKLGGGGGGALMVRRVASGKLLSASSHLLFRATILATLCLVCLFTVHYPSLLSHSFHLSSAAAAANGKHRAASRSSHRSLLGSSAAVAYGGAAWEKEVRRSAAPRRDGACRCW